MPSQPERWEPRTFVTANRPGERSAVAYRAVINALDIGQRRYAVDTAGPYAGQTHCNLFVWDATSAMGAEIPHNVMGPEQATVERPAGAPVPFGTRGFRELNANALLGPGGWLELHGPRYGWTECSEQEAKDAAQRGEPTIVGWFNLEGGPGHIAMVMPPPMDAVGVFVAQAGKTCFTFGPLSAGFGKRAVRYWTHA